MHSIFNAISRGRCTRWPAEQSGKSVSPKPTAREFNHWFHRERVDPAPAVHRVDKFLAMAMAVGAKSEAARYRLPDSPESHERVRAFLSSIEDERFIALHPGSSHFDLARRWEPARFSELARRVGTELGLRSIVTWGPGELELAAHIVDDSRGQAILSFESPSLLDLAELYRQGRIYVGLDTGPMHIATSVGLPSVVLFGSGDPAAYGPRSAGSRIVANYTGDRIEPMQSIAVEQVMQTIAGVLANTT